MNRDIEKRLELVEARNQRVDRDKAWETSLVRRLMVATVTFVLIGLYLSWLKVSRPWLNAIVPVAGFVLSTAVVQKAKELWLRQHK